MPAIAPHETLLLGVWHTIIAPEAALSSFG